MPYEIQAKAIKKQRFSASHDSIKPHNDPSDWNKGPYIRTGYAPSFSAFFDPPLHSLARIWQTPPPGALAILQLPH